MTPDPPVVLVVGAASRDVTDDDPRGWRLGGGVTYASLALAGLGIRVRALIGVDDEAAGARELDALDRPGVELHRVPLASGPVFENIERPEGRRQRCLAVSGPVLPSDLPVDWGHADALLLAPVAGEVGDAWLDVARAAPIVAMGWQGWLRRLRSGADVERVEPSALPILAAADLIGASRHDVAPGMPIEALHALLPAEATLLLTDGPHGGVVARREPGGRVAATTYPAIAADAAVDPTGAGDVFLATLVAGLAAPALAGDGPDSGSARGSTRRPTEALLRLAAAASSLTVEGLGVSAVPDLAAIRRRAARAPSRASR